MFIPKRKTGHDYSNYGCDCEDYKRMKIGWFTQFCIHSRKCDFEKQGYRAFDDNVQEIDYDNPFKPTEIYCMGIKKESLENDTCHVDPFSGKSSPFRPIPRD